MPLHSLEKLGLVIKDFGPIKDASISLRPLTIFTGPSNSGKSYAAILAHSIISSCNTFSRARLLHHRALERQPQFRYPGDDVYNNVEKFINKMKEENQKSCPVPDAITDAMRRFYYKHALEDNLPREIAKNFGSDPSDLVRTAKGSFTVQLSGHGVIRLVYASSRMRAHLDVGSGHKYMVVTESKKGRFGNAPVSENGDTTTIDLSDEQDVENRSHLLFMYLARSIAEKLHPGMPSKSHYLPAVRSGVVQAHRAISASIIENAPFWGLEQVQIPQLSGVMTDFISSTISMPGKHGPLAKLADQLEGDLLDGSILLHSPPSERSFPEVRYRHLDVDIPLHRTSSAVSELAPLVLYIRHMATSGSMMIMEESESHLHPSAQTILAKYLVRLVRNGMNVLVTTHSPFMLEQLGMFLEAKSVASSKRRDILGYGENDYLDKDEVSAYTFSDTSYDHGTTVHPIDITEEDGIDQSEFIKTDDELYDKSLLIEENRA